VKKTPDGRKIRRVSSAPGAKQKSKMKRTILKNSMLVGALLGVMVASQAQGGTYRYQTSGDYFLSTNTTPGQGWQIPAGGVPGAADIARFNWGNNTVTLAGVAPNINRFEMGVDESGGLVVNSGGSLTLTNDGRIGNNVNGGGAGSCSGFLTINAGGAVTNLGPQLRLGVSSSFVMGNLKGFITLNGGTLQDNGHLWVGAASNSIGTITITNGGVLNVGGNLGLGTVNASAPSGGKGFIYVREGGLLNLKQISAANSIQLNSVLDVSGSGVVIITNNVATAITNYVIAGRITAYGGLGTVGIDYGTSNALQTTIFAIAPVAPPPTNCVWNPALNNPTATQGFWNVSSNWNVGQVPFSGTTVKFNVTNALDCWVTNAAVADAVVMGDANGPGGTLIITNGGSLTTSQGSQAWSAIGYGSNAVLVVESGATANFANQLWVGFKTNATGTLIMNGGTVTVGGALGLAFGGGGNSGTGTALIRGGQLNLAQAPLFETISYPGNLGSGLLDVTSNGVVVINGNQLVTVNTEISAGLITNSTGAGLMVDYNNVNVGKTTIYAVGNSAITLAQTTWNPVNNNPSDPDGLWNVSTNWDGGLVPNSGTKVNFNLDGQLPCTVTNAVVAGRIVMGDSSGPGGTLIVTNGATLTVGSTSWSAIAYSSNAVMRVESGCSASFGFQLWIGFNPGADGTLIINGGTVNVADMIGLGWSGGKGTVQVNNGTLNLAQWNASQSISGASVLDVTGTGKVVITGNQTLSVSNYIVAGKITGSPGVYYSYNGITGKTTISTTVATPPPPQMVTGVTVSGATASLTYQTTAGHSYVIQQTPSLSPASWVNVPGSAVTNATGAAVTFPCPMPVGTNSLFYRTVSY
jgi:hypothetical protein